MALVSDLKNTLVGDTIFIAGLLAYRSIHCFSTYLGFLIHTEYYIFVKILSL